MEIEKLLRARQWDLTTRANNSADSPRAQRIGQLVDAIAPATMPATSGATFNPARARRGRSEPSPAHGPRKRGTFSQCDHRHQPRYRHFAGCFSGGPNLTFSKLDPPATQGHPASTARSQR
jgi:hypothetical protein